MKNYATVFIQLFIYLVVGAVFTGARNKTKMLLPVTVFLSEGRVMSCSILKYLYFSSLLMEKQMFL